MWDSRPRLSGDVTLMPRLYLVRHGQPEPAGDDPSLTGAGRAQAETMAALLAPKGPLPILSSPFRRACETAAPLARLWGASVRAEPRISEIPMPPGAPMPRAEWLKQVRTQRWPELDESLHRWRSGVLQALFELERDTVVVSHYVAINVAVGHALADDRVTCFSPANCSCTVLDSDGKKFRIVELGAEAAPRLA